MDTEVVIGLVAGAMVLYAVICGVFNSIYIKYGWFDHHHRKGFGPGTCDTNCDGDAQTSISRAIAAFFWWIFTVPLLIAWLYLVARRTSRWMVGTSLPAARVVGKDERK